MAKCNTLVALSWLPHFLTKCSIVGNRTHIVCPVFVHISFPGSDPMTSLWWTWPVFMCVILSIFSCTCNSFSLPFFFCLRGLTTAKFPSWNVLLISDLLLISTGRWCWLFEVIQFVSQTSGCLFVLRSITTNTGKENMFIGSWKQVSANHTSSQLLFKQI